MLPKKLTPLYKAIKDTYGTLFQVPEAPTIRTVAGKRLAGRPRVDVWWDRDMKNRSDEELILRQENNEKQADVITLTLAQVYSLIEALNKAVESR